MTDRQTERVGRRLALHANAPALAQTHARNRSSRCRPATSSSATPPAPPVRPTATASPWPPSRLPPSIDSSAPASRPRRARPGWPSTQRRARCQGGVCAVPTPHTMHSNLVMFRCIACMNPACAARFCVRVFAHMCASSATALRRPPPPFRGGYGGDSEGPVERGTAARGQKRARDDKILGQRAF